MYCYKCKQQLLENDFEINKQTDKYNKICIKCKNNFINRTNFKNKYESLVKYARFDINKYYQQSEILNWCWCNNEKHIETQKLLNIINRKNIALCLICNDKNTEKIKNEIQKKRKKNKFENEMKNILNDNDINFEQQKKYEDLYDKSFLYYDFFLPKYNTLIECDGKQHFKPVKKFGGEEQFKKQILHDKMKNEYAINNKINLIRIKYKELCKFTEIFDKLKETLNNNKNYYRYFV